ncbi:MAG: hypothetical protein JNG88_07670 [Phycisphaerales bacterium]|nr:hypothetical protein [Phycisphaerales bacterium]
MTNHALSGPKRPAQRVAVRIALAVWAVGWLAPHAISQSRPVPTTNPAALASFAGSWDTTFGLLELSQIGASVTGQYAIDGAKATVEGTVDGRRLTFRYVEANARGEGWFELAADGDSFEGKWRASGVPLWMNWIGKRAAGTNPQRFDGVWSTTFGAMRLATDGEEMAGSYSFAGISRIRGKVESRTLKFHYDQPDGEKGEGEFTLSDDGSRFSGTWKSNVGKGGKWQGERVLPRPGRAWLVVLEAHWESSLGAPEYSYGEMLRSFFTRMPSVEVRHRFVHDVADLKRFCAEVIYLAEPVVLYVSSHGTKEGVVLGSEIAGADVLIECVRDLQNLKMLHFGSCLVMSGDVPRKIHESRPKSQQFPISGFTKPADWAGSAIVDFTYLELVLERGMAPADAVKTTRDLVKFARENSDTAIPGSGLKVFEP